MAQVPAQRPVKAPWGRSPDDLLLLYHRRHHRHAQGRDVGAGRPLFNVIGAGGNALLGIPPAVDIPDLIARITGPEHLRPTSLIACPLMHGTGQFSNLIAFNQGGTAAYLPSRKFNAMELWDEVDQAGKAPATSSSWAWPSRRRCWRRWRPIRAVGTSRP